MNYVFGVCLSLSPAQSYDHMQLYAEVVGEDSTTDDYLRIATHFQRVSDHLRAGQFFLKAREFTKVHTVVCIISIVKTW